MVEKSFDYLRLLEGKCGYMDIGLCALGLLPSAWTDCACLEARAKAGAQECICLQSSVDGFWLHMALTLAKLVVSDDVFESPAASPVRADMHSVTYISCRAKGLWVSASIIVVVTVHVWLVRTLTATQERPSSSFLRMCVKKKDVTSINTNSSSFSLFT